MKSCPKIQVQVAAVLAAKNAERKLDAVLVSAGALAARAAAMFGHARHDQALHAVGILTLAQGQQHCIELYLCQTLQAGKQLHVLGLFDVNFSFGK